MEEGTSEGDKLGTLLGMNEEILLVTVDRDRLGKDDGNLLGIYDGNHDEDVLGNNEGIRLGTFDGKDDGN